MANPAGATRPSARRLSVAYVADHGLLGCLPARVEDETVGSWTSGMTVTDSRAPAARRNALVATAIDVRGFWDSVLTAYTNVAAGMTPGAEPLRSRRRAAAGPSGRGETKVKSPGTQPGGFALPPLLRHLVRNAPP